MNMDKYITESLLKDVFRDITKIKKNHPYQRSQENFVCIIMMPKSY